jgi:hypothetical protein
VIMMYYLTNMNNTFIFKLYTNKSGVLYLLMFRGYLNVVMSKGISAEHPVSLCELSNPKSKI